MGWLDQMKGSYEAGKAQQRHAQERAYRRKLRDEQESRQEGMQRPNKAAAFAGRVAASPIGEFGKKAAKATEKAAVAGVNWVATGSTSGKRPAKSPAAPKRRKASSSAKPKVIYVQQQAPPPKKRKRKTSSSYWDNPPF